jgi:hypothetical protein
MDYKLVRAIVEKTLTSLKFSITVSILSELYLARVNSNLPD